MLTMQGGDPLVGGLPIIHITYQQYIANPSAYQDPDVIVHITGFPTAGNMPADYVGYDSNLNMEDIGNIATKSIAKIEPSDTALYLHPVGSYFINKDGNACVTDVQISVGGTITLGTNCHVVDGVANDINSNLYVVAIHDYADVGATNGNRTMYTTSLGAGTYIVTSFSDTTTGEDSIASHTINTSSPYRNQQVRFNTTNGGGSMNVMIFTLSETTTLTITGDTAINQIMRNQTVVLKVKG